MIDNINYHTLEKKVKTVVSSKKPKLLFLDKEKPGESANAVPHFHKLCSRVSHIWGNRRGQHIRSAMDEPHPGETTFMIMVSPLPGKYELLTKLGTTPSDPNHSIGRTTFLMQSVLLPF